MASGRRLGPRRTGCWARILGAAVEARYLAVNPCGIRQAASDGAPEMRIATVDQVAAIANRVPTRYRALVLVAAVGGSLREVMDRLGHSTTVAAVRYQHVLADWDAAIAREPNRLIEGC